MTTPSQRAQAEAFGLLFVVAQHLARRADLELQPLKLTSSQWLLLAVVFRHPRGAPTLTEAARAYGSSRQNVKQVARQLETRGFLKLAPDPADARALRLHATRKVTTSFDTPAARARQQRFLARLFTGLPAADIVSLEALLRRWLTALTDPWASPSFVDTQIEGEHEHGKET